MNVVDLPFPVSVNRLWRKGRHGGIHLSPAYHDWRVQADLTAMLQRGRRHTIRGPFTAEVALDRDKRKPAMDLDNHAKSVLDWAQSRELIFDDKFCERLTIEWVDHANAPEGCRVVLRELA